MAYRDLREYLAALEKKGLLCHIEAEVDKDREISAVCRRAFQRIPEPTGLHSCSTASKDMISLVVGVLGGSREIYATALETEVDKVLKGGSPGQKTPQAPPGFNQAGLERIFAPDSHFSRTLSTSVSSAVA